MSKPALCQCISCERYLSRNRSGDDLPVNNMCDECWESGIPLAGPRGTLTDPLQLEVLSLISEECSETTQRKEKIVRWGWDVVHDGTTQRDKLEAELGDVLAMVTIAIHNGVITAGGVATAMLDKIRKLREDAAGPRERILHAKIPTGGFLAFAVPMPGEPDDHAVLTALDKLLGIYCRGCGKMHGKYHCQCMNDE